METTEGNKLICTFMDEQYTGVRFNDYDNSWYSLMPVVEKCTQIGYRDQDFDTDIYLEWETIFDNESMFLGNHVDEVWDSCIAFIQYYNEQP